MIQPDKITDYHKSQAAYEELALFATLVAGKPARFMAKALDHLLMDAHMVYGDEPSPFELVRILIGKGLLHAALEKHRIGQYTRIERCWAELTAFTETQDTPGGYRRVVHQVDLRSVESLERVHGIGMKTARFIVVHSVEAARHAVLDTHVMKELRALGYPIDVRRRQDGDKIVEYIPLDRDHYLIYESYVLECARKAKLTPAEWDLQTWNKWTRPPKEEAVAA